MIGRRIAWGIAIGALLLAIVVATLLFADIYTVVEENKRCAPHFPEWSQFPGWLGCTTSVHEGLAGGLIGGAGALFAAWLAFTAVQQQLAEEKQRRHQQHLDAKEAALVCITQPVHAAATALSQITNAMQVTEPSDEAAADKLASATSLILTSRSALKLLGLHPSIAGTRSSDGIEELATVADNRDAEVPKRSRDALRSNGAVGPSGRF